MGSLSRTVEGWMGDDLYRKLGSEPDIDLTWRLLRELIGQQLFSREYVTVPHFESAVYYNQLFVFKKIRSVWSCLGVAPPAYKTVGNLDYLVDRQTSTWTPQFDFSPWDVADGLSMYREYSLRVSSNGGPGEEKYVELMVMGAHARTAPAPTPESLTIRRELLQDLNGTKKLYVIHDVVFASYVRLCVRIGNRHKTHIYDIDTPIGFRYKKYKVRTDGLFVRELHTTLKLTDSDARWLKPSPQPIPNWNVATSRRFLHPGLRKTRNNLTIPSPEVARDRRRSWAVEAAGALREDRNRANSAAVVVDDVNDEHDDDAISDDNWPRSARVRNVRRNFSVQSVAN